MMNIIGCLDTADEGEYDFNGQSIEDYTEDELARIRNREIGFVFQSFNLLPKLTAIENVELPLVYQNMHSKERRERAQLALERMGLKERIGHRPTELSVDSSSASPSRGRSLQSRRSYWRMSRREISTERLDATSWTCSIICTRREIRLS